MKHAHQGTITGEGYGYVYVMSYPGSDKVKIGHTMNPTKRAKDIGGTLAPEQPALEAYFWCSERREAVERAAHKLEAASRHNGEWFSISVHRAVEVVKAAAGQVNVSAQLVFDRNQWEARAAAEQAAKIAAIPGMTDEQVFSNYGFIYSKATIVSKGVATVLTDAYDIALMHEYVARKAAADAAAKAAAEQATRVLLEKRLAAKEAMKVEAEQLSLEQLCKMLHGRYPSVRRHVNPDRYEVLHAEWAKKDMAQREALANLERLEAEKKASGFFYQLGKLLFN